MRRQTSFITCRPLPWLDDTEPNADMWATADESREWVVALYRRVWAQGDASWWAGYRDKLEATAREAGGS